MRMLWVAAAWAAALATAGTGAGAQGAAQKKADTTKKAAPAMQHDMSKMGEAEAPSAWRQLDAFHEVMGSVWHPVAAGDVKAARGRAAELVAAARTWSASRGPVACDNPQARTKMTEMMEHLRSFADASKREASDDAIKATLKAAHDAFEAVAEPCMAAVKKP